MNECKSCKKVIEKHTEKVVRGMCMKCYGKEQRMKNPERLAEQRKRWYDNNKEKRMEYQEKNKDKLRLKYKEYREKNKERYKEWQRLWYLKNKARLAEERKAYRQENKEKSREYDLKRFYGITIAEYEIMVREQNGLCGICKKPSKLVVDHDHDTGKVRGLLCNNCNTAIGLMKDKAVSLIDAATYLLS